ncbi:MAG TPA: hypothetical protein PK437_02410 [Thiobacillaceae bacterium]|nr:hypothetical protein [Thiobacillaceae bacterium]
MKGSPIDDVTLGRLRDAIDAAAPRPHHSGLHEAVGQVLPGQSFNFALTRGGWYRPGGVIRPDGSRISDDLQAWAEAELDACGGDMDEFLDRHGQDGLYTTRHSGRTHYFVAPYGPGPADYLQLEVEELREVLDRHLVSPESPPADLEELTDPLTPQLLDAQPVGPARYLFRRLTDIRLAAARLPSSVGETSPATRFLTEWATSRAAGRGRFCDYWILALREHQDRYHNSVLSATPVSLLARRLRHFPWRADTRGVELSEQIQAFDRAAGYPSAWYFHLVAGALVPRDIAQHLMQDLVDDFHYLPELDAKLLEGWVRTPYSV